MAVRVATEALRSRMHTPLAHRTPATSKSQPWPQKALGAVCDWQGRFRLLDLGYRPVYFMPVLRATSPKVSWEWNPLTF